MAGVEARQCLLLLVDVQLRKWLMHCSLVGDMVRDPIRVMVGCWKCWRGWVGGRVGCEQGSDVGWQLVIWSLAQDVVTQEVG